MAKLRHSAVIVLGFVALVAIVAPFVSRPALAAPQMARGKDRVPYDWPECMRRAE